MIFLIAKAARNAALEAVDERAKTRSIYSLKTGGRRALAANAFDFASCCVRARLHLLLPVAGLFKSGDHGHFGWLD